MISSYPGSSLQTKYITDSPRNIKPTTVRTKKFF